MINPAGESSPIELSKLIIQIMQVGDDLTYHFHLELPEQDMIDIAELKALVLGLQESKDRLISIIREYEDDPGE